MPSIHVETKNLADSTSPAEGQGAASRPALSHQHEHVTPPRTIRAPPERLVEGDLVLRRWKLSDAAELHAAASGSAVELARWMPWAADGYDLTKAQQFLDFTSKAWDNGESYDFAIIVDGRISGSFGLMTPATKAPNTLEVGYWLAKEATGRGLATRAASLLTRTAFAVGAEHVQIRHDERNHRSGAIPRRLGFKSLGLESLPAGKGGGKEVSVLWQKDVDSETS
ncbi:acetyltransferase (GNAT) domain protein [Metarhizium robertsii]|uniref:GCN5-related N-acetyltransferase (GNAT) domain protein n=2 Tax=Metarhizium robertsii TaxID=568076 RepID=E9EJQ3_METRA|nr:GCN5-related N-acetyltransferase (GNAT) domain protein [Metarhizium robertsii ARSEF 23]EFZ03377.1 GCN5-related N-acetyltransferase (GNAT) domain protein [Metarhizium robertsii ARSEF 23]EXU97581.1 acetyltransferase (GNAT) domain protein [Metarhizium robertsii]